MQIGYGLPIIATTPNVTGAQANSDKGLIQRIAEGDQKALRALFHRHNLKIFRFIGRLVGDTSLAEDLASEVFFEVWRQAGQFQRRFPVRTWLLTIARDKAVATLEGRPGFIWDNKAAELPEDTSGGRKVTILNRRGPPSRGLNQLSGADREIIELVYYHQQTIDEVARIACVARSTVLARVSGARRQIRKFHAERSAHDGGRYIKPPGSDYARLQTCGGQQSQTWRRPAPSVVEEAPEHL